MSIHKSEILALLLLCASVILVFGLGATNLGFYYEDSGFITHLTSADLQKFWILFKEYVPGRNLHMLWQVLLYKLVGDPVSHIHALHLIQSVMDSVLVAFFFVLLRRLGASATASLIAAGLLAFWPIHGETHYWPPGAPENQCSTLFLLLFILTTIRLLGAARPPRWLWVLDLLFFVSALFTYDQLVIVIVLILGARLPVLLYRYRQRAFSLVVVHLIPALVVGFYLFKKVPTPSGQGPILTADSLLRFWPTFKYIFSYNFGAVWLQMVRPLYNRATATDMCLSVLALVIVGGASIALLRLPTVTAAKRSIQLFVVGAMFFALTYVPVALWYVSPRHNFLPSFGLFACVAAIVDLLLAVAKPNLLKAMPALAAGLAVFFFSAASRGESWYWEKAFSVKRQLYSELAERMKGTEILVLQEFPVLLGPAEVILPHDAKFGPRLVYDKSTIAAFESGDISSSPAHEGVFLETLTRFYGPAGFSYHSKKRILRAVFTKWIDENRFGYDINPVWRATYNILECATSDYRGPFAVQSVSARRKEKDVILSIDIESGLPPTSHLVMTVSVGKDLRFEDWGRKDREGFLNVSPVLLDSCTECAGGIRFKGSIVLHDVPDGNRCRLHFFAVTTDRIVASFPDWETPIE